MKLHITNENPSEVRAYFDNDFQRTELKKFLTIKVPGARYTKAVRMKRWDGSKCFYNRFAETFPIGFIGRAAAKFPDAEIIDSRVYTPIKFKVPPINGIELRMYQKDAILHAFEYRNCIVQAATNAGKSAIMSALVRLLYEEKVLIVVHRVELLQQLRKMIIEQTGMQVGYITSEEAAIDPYVNVVMVMTMLSRMDTNPAVKDVFLRSKVLMVDECHHQKAATHTSVFCRSKAVYRFGFSGTVPEEDTYDGWLVRQYIGDVVFNISNKELIEQGISAEPRIYMLKYQHNVDYPGIVNEIRADNAAKGKKFTTPWQEREEVYKRVFAKVLERHVVNEVNRNQVIVDKVCSEYKNEQILIVVDYLAHGRMIQDLLEKRMSKEVVADDITGYGMDFIHGQSETRKGSLIQFRRGQMRVLISTSIIDEGIDISRIQVLVLAGGKKSKRQILQRIGRGLRRKEGENRVTILDFFDMDGKYLEKHSKERLKIYNKEEFHVEVVDL